MQNNQDQAEFWNGPSGQNWVTQEAAVDATFAPVLSRVLALANIGRGTQVVDVGCGSGASTIAAAARVGTSGHVLGLDISAPMLDRARARAEGMDQVHFDLADAATYAFRPAAFDVLMSRFGVMFFADPVAAFVNMAQALRPTGRVVFACWGSIEANPFFTLAAKAANARLGKPPAVDPDAPGPFAFRDIDRVAGILRAAGLRDVEAEPRQMLLTPPGTLADVAALMIALGPAARAMNHFNGSEADATAIKAGIADLFAQFETPDGVAIPAEINFFVATNP